MTTLLARVLLTLVVVAIAPAVPETCTLCPNEKKPRNGNAVVFPDETGLVTCNEFAKEIITNSDGEFCDDSFAHAYQVVCGCPGVKAGPCPGICETGNILATPNVPTPYWGFTCSVIDQIIRGTPGDTSCPGIGVDPTDYCTCKVKVKPGQNMGSGVEGNGGAGTGMNGMAGGRQRRLGGVEERFPPRSARGLAM